MSNKSFDLQVTKAGACNRLNIPAGAVKALELDKWPAIKLKGDLGAAMEFLKGTAAEVEKKKAHKLHTRSPKKTKSVYYYFYNSKLVFGDSFKLIVDEITKSAMLKNTTVKKVGW